MSEYPEIPDAFGHWLAGFIDGEGSFLIVKHKSNSRRRAVAYACSLRIALRADDLGGLRDIAAVTGFGKVGTHSNRPSQRSPGTNPSAQWIVQSKRDLLRLVEVLDHHPLRMKKSRDYAIWREAVILWAAMHRLRPPDCQDWTAIGLLREKLLETRAYQPQLTLGPALRAAPLSLF